MKPAAVGFRAHSRWTGVVALALTKGTPTVLARQRMHLVETFTYEFRQPYHTGGKCRSTRLALSFRACRKKHGAWRFTPSES
jgi:hypothetical protein